MKFDFKAELKKLIDEQENPPDDPLAEIASSQLRVLETLRDSSAGISLQVEEIYDIIKESSDNANELKLAAGRENRLLDALIAANDLLDDMMQYAAGGASAHSDAILAKMDEIAESCGLERTGCIGERLDPRIHTVSSAESSGAPVESVIQVLQSGYMYRDRLIRKAAVIISKGSED